MAICIFDYRFNFLETTVDKINKMVYRLMSVTDALNHTTTFGYDLMSNRTTQTDALTNTTNYEYDNFNNLKKSFTHRSHSAVFG